MVRLRSATCLLGLTSATLALRGRGYSAFSVVKPGGIDDVLVTEDNMMTGTFHGNKTRVVHQHRARRADDEAALTLELVNLYNAKQTINAYVTGLDGSNRVVFVRADGSMVYPSSGGSETPVLIKESVAIPLTNGSQRMPLPTALYGGRVWFADGQLQFYMVKTPYGDGMVQPSVMNLRDPSAAVNWSFAELTYTRERSVFANISYVDFVGLILSMALKQRNNRGTQTIRGLDTDAVTKICSGMVDQSDNDGFPWSRLCVADDTGTPIRVLSPNSYGTINQADFGQYWDAYVDRVWEQYRQTALVIDTQSAAGQVECRVSPGNNTLLCGGGDNRGYKKPSANDIWGCNSGPFERLPDDNGVHVAVIPRLCAAFVRSTLLLAGGNIQPRLNATHYYRDTSASHYSRLIHELELEGRGYAFPYDDVNPEGEADASGIVASGEPDTLTVYVGVPPR
ncbi:hypothetical protein L249_0150 [Ophiocordyceps polyrhachis-furcata BCC 54312]|uniref:GH64 domain-containing protein n=1 Tax=Ophiocordyceps polyrhachis-furcata BCC 54312 TaxID=1330021 RepID=A0A367LCR2_9HYPO|nr:hypothetical protein L249_0150 [Ophiocordyceps polyrhachis-furcata BCC 54312]